MIQYNILYDWYFKKYRIGMRGSLKHNTIQTRVRNVLEKLGERDRHLLVMISTYNSVKTIAELEDTDVRKLNRKIDVAINHLITPANVEYITGRKLFKHTGTLLSSMDFDTRTINALRNKSNITTDDDLKAWLKYSEYHLFRLPGCGKAAIVQIVNRLYEFRK